MCAAGMDMDLPALLNLKQRDFAALAVFCMIGFLVACVVRDPTWAVYGSILVTYHCFVGWLLFLRDGRFERVVPVSVLVLIHVIFIAVVAVLVGTRDRIPRFDFLPVPFAAIGASILATAAGRERKETKPRELRGHRLHARLRRREAAMHGPLPRRAMDQARAAIATATAAPALPVETAERVQRRATPPEATATCAIAEVEPEVLAAAPAEAVPAAPPEPVIVVLPPQAPVQTQPMYPVSPAVQSTRRSSKRSRKNKGGASRPKQPAQAFQAAEPKGQGDAQPEANSAKPKIQYFRDTSIAESLRFKLTEEEIRSNPILAATAEDHEEWLEERGTFNPTHRKIGMTVREEYEQWLMDRTLARTEPPLLDGQEAAGQQ